MNLDENFQYQQNDKGKWQYLANDVASYAEQLWKRLLIIQPQESERFYPNKLLCPFH